MSSKSSRQRYVVSGEWGGHSSWGRFEILICWIQHTSGNKKAEEDANKDSENQLKEIKEAGKKGESQVISDLLKAVFDVKPVAPERVEGPK